MTSRKIQLTVAWLISASLIMGIAIWQAQVTVAREAAAKHRNPEPPKKTKHAIRPDFHQWSGDVVADYIERCKKGITDQEIAWVLEDYVNAGLDEQITAGMTLEKALAYRAGENRFFQDALVDGLRLSREQSRDLGKKLAELTDKEKTEVMAIPDTAGRASAIPAIAIMVMWGMKEELMPWNICKLNAEQEKLTWKEWTALTDVQKQSYTVYASPFKISGQEEGRFLLSSPFEAMGISARYNARVAPIEFQFMNIFLPLLQTQQLITDPEAAAEDSATAEPGNPNGESDLIPDNDARDDKPSSRATLLKNVKKLTSSQLRILLISSYNTATELRAALAEEMK